MELIVRLHDPVALPPRREDGQPDRQAHSQTDRQIDRLAERQTDRQTTGRFLLFVLFCPVAPLTLRHDSSSCYGCRKQTEDREAAVNK
jgi:hypothetical protein